VTRALVPALVAALVAGGAGAVLRAGLVARAPRTGTTVANLTGTLVLALVIVGQRRGVLDDAAAVVLGVGLSGSLTTFSGWMAVLAAGLPERPLRTVVVDLLLPLVGAVGLTVLVFATVG
jgi:fluoride ion exporter CrcB/FEX